MDDREFRLAADRALDEVERLLAGRGDDGRFDVERRGRLLQIVFDPPHAATFVVSPHAPARQIWVAALPRSYRLRWAPAAAAFVVDGETLADLLARLVREHLAATN